MIVRYIVTLIAVMVAIGYFARSTPPSGEASKTLVAGPSRQVTDVSPEMTGDTLEAYRTWSRDPRHYGAFAISDFGEFGWVKDYNDIEFAERQAIAYCDQPSCRVIARQIPFEDTSESELMVSQRTLEGFQELLKLPGPKAFAIHPNGAFGSYYGGNSIPTVVQGALFECSRWSQDRSDVSPENVNPEDCGVVYRSIR